jgi:signal peptidase I
MSANPTSPVRSWRHGWAALAVSTVSRTVLGALALLLAASVLPVLIGWQSSVVMSGSMTPTFSPGDVAVVRPVDTASLEPGQVLLVDDPDVPGQLRLHRLVSVEAGGLELKGDANPAADGSLVDPAGVHGVVTVALPLVGEPAVWIAQHRVWPLVGTAAGLIALLALALAHRRPDDEPPAPPPARAVDPRSRARRTTVRLLRRGSVLIAAVLVTVALPGAAAKFTDTSLSPNLTIPSALWWTCPDVGGNTGANAARYYRMQENFGTTATNTGSAGSAANGTYSSTGVTLGQAGPTCGAGETKAVKLDGVAGAITTSGLVSNPQTFSVQIWFRTTTTTGGKLIGFGGSATGASGNYDRHLYMTNSGQLVFGVYSGAVYTVISPATYNNGAWHLATGTYSPATGMKLYVDGAQVGTPVMPPNAEAYDGYWRIGYDNLDNWGTTTPSSRYFAGWVAQASVYTTVLTATQVSQAWQIAG